MISISQGMDGDILRLRGFFSGEPFRVDIRPALFNLFLYSVNLVKVTRHPFAASGSEAVAED